MPLIDDCGVVRVVGQRGIKPRDGFLVGFDEFVNAIPGHQHVVGRYAGLSGVEGFAESDAFGGMTIPWLATVYPWVKSFHVIAVIAWMAGIFYLPRLYVYHCSLARGSTESDGEFFQECCIAAIVAGGSAA